MAVRTYSIADDTALGAVYDAGASADIMALDLASCSVVNVVICEADDLIEVHTDGDPSAPDIALIDAAVNGHEAPTTLEQAKAEALARIDGRTGDLIAGGFDYSEKKFSLSLEAQIKMTAAHQIRNEAGFVFPVKWNTKDDKDTHEVQDATEMHGLYMTGIGHIRQHLDSGTALKDQVRAATTIVEVDAVEDER